MGELNRDTTGHLNESNNTKLSCMDNCDAPLCPLAYQNSAQWFPDEDVCKSLAYRRLPWIRTQRKIHRLYLKGGIAGDETCFTQSMLENIKHVRKGIQGIKPENLYKRGTG